MAAAVAKLCDVHELILLARKISSARPGRARQLGLPGHAVVAPAAQSSDRRPARRSRCSCYWGLSLGAGDALIGVNPAVDTVENVSRLLAAPRQAPPPQRARRRRSACSPTSRRSSPASSAARRWRSCSRASPAPRGRNLLEFDITVDLLDRRLPHDGRARAAAGRGRAVHVLRDRPGERVHLRQAQRHRHDHDRGPLLRPGPALRPVHGQQRHRLHRPGDAPRQLRDDPLQPAGPLHGQAAGPADGHGALLHAALQHHAGRPADRHASC